VISFRARGVGGEGFEEILAVVVVADGHVQGEAGLAQGFEGFEHRGVIFGIALVMGEVAVDEEGGGGGRGQNFAAGLGEAVPGLAFILKNLGSASRWMSERRTRRCRIWRLGGV